MFVYFLHLIAWRQYYLYFISLIFSPHRLSISKLLSLRATLTGVLKSGPIFFTSWLTLILSVDWAMHIWSSWDSGGLPVGEELCASRQEDEPWLGHLIGGDALVPPTRCSLDISTSPDPTVGGPRQLVRRGEGDVIGGRNGWCSTSGGKECRTKRVTTVRSRGKVSRAQTTFFAGERWDVEKFCVGWRKT